MSRDPSPLVSISFFAAFACSAASAASAPADPCSLLPATEVSKALGQEVAAPQSSTAPRPFKDTARGTDCLYKPKSGRGSIAFRIYFDSSAAQSKDLFKRLGAFFGEGTPASGIGDEAYFDSKHALHARKGNVRFYLELSGGESPAPAKEAKLKTLGAGIANHL